MRAVGHHERDHQFGCGVEDLAAADTTLDGLGWLSIAGQIGAPLLLHPVQEPHARGRVLHPHESHRPGVVGRGRGERFGDRGLDELWRDRFVAESPHRTPQQLGLGAAERDGFLGAQPEQVLVAGAQQGAGVGSVVLQRQAAHDRDRNVGQLALDEVGRGGDLVGDRDLGDDELVAVPVV